MIKSKLNLDLDAPSYKAQPSRAPKGPNWRNEKSSKKGADENEPYEINIKQISVELVFLDCKIVA